jgi:probable HAF family extracellular repeat protein
MIQNLGTLGGPESCALYTNERGQVTGNSYTNSTPNLRTGVPTVHPFLWENGTILDLGTLGGTEGNVFAINGRGQVVGQSNLTGDLTAHPFLWDRGSLTDLGTLGGSFGFADWINGAGDVVGGATNQNDQAFLAFVWRHGVMTNLATVAGDDCSLAQYINSEGQIVGSSFPCSGGSSHAFLWDSGSMIDLNTFVPPSANLLLTDALYINDHGEIAGNGVLPNGDQHAFLLIPCGEREEGCVDAPLDPAIVAKSQASGAVPKPMTAEELASFKERIARMAGRNRGFGLWPKR